MYRRTLIALFLLAAALATAQKKEPAPITSGAVIQSETKLVVVDVAATDKKGNFVADLEAKDFRVWEDNKEQVIKSFSRGSEVAPDHYMILFFDGMNLSSADQSKSKQLATQFAQAVANPARRVAVIDFDNNLRVAQDFTANVERLTAAIKTVRLSVGNRQGGVGLGAMSRGGRNGGPTEMPMAPGAGSFASRALILSLKSLAKNLNSVPGRKTMVWFTGGFQGDNSELQMMLDVFNRSNIGIFPVDMANPTGLGPIAATRPSPLRSIFSSLLDAMPSPTPAAFGFQQGGGTTGGGATGGGAGGGGATTPPSGGAGTGGAGGANPGAGTTSPTPNTGNIGMPTPGRMPGDRLDMGRGRTPDFGMPQFDNSTANRQMLGMLADKTGGFVVQQTSNMVEGLGRIGREQDSIYVLGYTPASSQEGTCHSLKVKVNRGGVNLRSRNGYCNARPTELLAGNPIQKELESRIEGSQPGNLSASIQLPYFYNGENVARVNAAMELALGNLKFEKQKGKPHAAINVLGTAYTADGAIAARFSDTVNIDLENQDEVDQFKATPYHYENQFEIAPGVYSFKIVFSSGRDSFGKLEAPLMIESYSPSQFRVSSLALSTQFQPAPDFDPGAGVSLLGDSVPLVASGMQVIPSGTNQFPKKQTAGFYCEIYEPLLVTPNPASPLAVGIQVRVFERKSGQKKIDTGLVRVAVPPKSDSPVIRLGLKAPIDELETGSYFLELTASDTGNQIAKRSVPFEIK